MLGAAPGVRVEEVVPGAWEAQRVRCAGGNGTVGDLDLDAFRALLTVPLRFTQTEVTIG